MSRTNRPRAVALAAAVAASLAGPVAHAEKYGLQEGKPYAGTTINILSVVTPQFDGLKLRDEEFTELTGIETEWTFIPFGSLQEKITAEGVAANGTFDVVNYLDTWGPPNAHWLARIDERMEADGISMDRYPAAFAKSAQFEGETLGFPLRAHAQLMFYRKDLIPEAPETWADVVRIGKELRETNPEIEPLALYYNNDGNRQNLFIWLNYLWAAGADVFDDEGRPAWTSEAGLKATEDYIALHTVDEGDQPRLAVVRRAGRAAVVHAGKVRDAADVVVGLLLDDRSGELHAHRGPGRLRRHALLRGRDGDLRDLDAVLDLHLLGEPGRRVGVPEVAVEPRDGPRQRDRARGRGRDDRQQRGHPRGEPAGPRGERRQREHPGRRLAVAGELGHHAADRRVARGRGPSVRRDRRGRRRRARPRRRRPRRWRRTARRRPRATRRSAA